MWNAYPNPFDVERNTTRCEIPLDAGPVGDRECRSEAYVSLLVCSPPFTQPLGAGRIG